MKKTVFKGSLLLYMILLTMPIAIMIVWYFVRATYNPNTGAFALDNFNFLWQDIEYSGMKLPIIWPILVNTLLYSMIIVAAEVTLTIPAAYAFSRLDFAGKKAMLKFLFIMRSFPGITLIIATFLILLKMGLVNTYPGIVLVAVTGSLPGRIYIMKGFFDGVPWDLEWAAMVDGCSRFRAFYKVIIPTVSTGIGAISTFAFFGAYGEWFLFKLLIFDNLRLTMGGYVAKLITKENIITEFGLICALGLFYTIPIIIFYLFTQKYFMKIQLGGRKGV